MGSPLESRIALTNWWTQMDASVERSGLGWKRWKRWKR
jgi:hypothetical protein